jgi:hypothetical protein
MYYDSELLASVAGLGSLKTEKNGGEVYIKGPKCLGMPLTLSQLHNAIIPTLTIPHTDRNKSQYVSSL